MKTPMPDRQCRVIALASAKGGTGKTTLTACLAVEAAKSGRVVMIDADPQQSLTLWHRARLANDDEGENPGLMRAGTEPLAEKVELLRKAGADWVLIDLPPGDVDLLEAGIAAADYIVIPIRASSLDVQAIGPTTDLCSDYVRPFGIVTNAVEPSWKISSTVAPFCKAAALHLLKATVTQRQAYTGAMVAGATGPEYHDARQAKVCATEIKVLWDEIRAEVLALCPSNNS
ncbi:MAG: ParA family protein [Hyphomicrobiaceae bacterium]|nr:ParA family protein [Hyphomicrobiaceae bacterium]